MENREKIQDKPLWIYSGNRTPDVAALVMILLGCYILTGLFSSAPGMLIRPVCFLLKSWFGNGAVVLSVVMILGGIAILALRRAPRIRAKQKTIRQKMFLSGSLFWLICGIFAGRMPNGQGGAAGAFLLGLFAKMSSVSFSLFLLWLLLLADVFFLFELWRYKASFLRLIHAFLEKLSRLSEPDTEERSDFNWEDELFSNSKPFADGGSSRVKRDQQWDSASRRSNLSKNNEGSLRAAPFRTRPAERVSEMGDLMEPDEEGPEPVYSESSYPDQIDRGMRDVRTKAADARENPRKNSERKERLEKIALMNPVKQNIPSEGSLPKRSTQLPPLNLLDTELGFYGQNTDQHEFMEELEAAMDEFGTPIQVIGCEIGPSVIQYQVVPGNISREDRSGKVTSRNIRVSQVAQLDRDLAVRMGVSNLSIQAPVPGESYIGIDIPNPNSMKVRLRPLIGSAEFRRQPSPLNVALGRNITGKPVVVDLGSMPHLLVAGTTNSGKSICLRAMAVCLAMNNTPEQVRMVMIDPKRVELYRFNGLPHLLGKVETEYERSIAVLEWAVQEMQNRYKLFETTGSHKIQDYNRYAEQNGLRPLPFIVIFIDEMAEIMKGADKQGEVCIDKLASLARAAGMHLVIATQRPDTTIITGKIKTNIPARIALTVASAIDSRVIMGKPGAEKLLSRGDMYFVDPSQSVPVRVQGALLTDNEIDRVVNLWKKLWKPETGEEETPWEDFMEANSGPSTGEGNPRDEKKLREAVRLVCRTRKASAAYLSGKLKISFPTASRLLARMEDMGVVGPMQTGGKAREVIWDEDEGEDFYASGSSSAGYEEDCSYGDE